MRTGHDHYSNIYATQLEAEAKWLRVGAIEKANSIERLILPRIAHPVCVIELGAGTGAIIAELQRRNFADGYLAVDYSPNAVEYMKRNLTNVEIPSLVGDDSDVQSARRLFSGDSAQRSPAGPWPGAMQIEVIDDGSTDDLAAQTIRRVGGGFICQGASATCV
jgi:SAM-dependent methyltransferase